MKTIHEAATDRSIYFESNIYCDFIAGVEFAQRWIPVEEELPEKDGKFLVKEKYGISLLFFNSHYNCWDDEEGDDYYSDSVGGKVTHWRPIELE